MIPYGKHYIDEDDIDAVVEVLKSDWLTTGPCVEAFEKAISDYVRAPYAIAVSNGTAALHCAMHAIDIGPGDEVIVPAITFVATANCISYLGGKPVFADVDPENLLIDVKKVEEKITSRTKAIIAVDYAGHPCDYHPLRKICTKHGLNLISDACHALGARYHGEPIGSIADLTVFSFHPVKHITTGEGGMVVTARKDFADKMKRFRNHGINSDFRQRERQGSWHYEMVELGYNYRICDIQCALGLSQIKKLSNFLKRRRNIAIHYLEAFYGNDFIIPQSVAPNVEHAYHLFVVRLNSKRTKKSRREIFQLMREKQIGVNVHYMPVHLQAYYRKLLGTGHGDCPVAEHVYKEILSLPIYPTMTMDQINIVIDAICNTLNEP